MEMNDNQKKQAMFALDERIIQLIGDGKKVEATIAYGAYLAVGGYYSFDCFLNIAAIRGKETYHSLLHVS